VVLLFITAVIFVFMLFFADSAERAVVQGMMVGSVIAVITATLLLIQFLDNPFRDGFGGLKPVAMERTQHILDTQRLLVHDTGALPCDAHGRPR
jgi:sugar phosphate permease